MRKRIVALLAMVVMMVAMLAAAAPAFAQGVGGCDPQPGQTERSQGEGESPPQGHPGAVHSDNLHSVGSIGFGDRVEECA